MLKVMLFHAFGSPDKNIQWFLIYTLGEHCFLLSHKCRDYSLVYIAYVHCFNSIPSAMLFTSADIISVLSFVEVIGSGSLSLLAWICMCMPKRVLIFCKFQWRVFCTQRSLRWQSWLWSVGLKALVFVTFDWYFSALQPEYPSSEPANSIFAAPKAHQPLCETGRSTMDRSDPFFFNLCRARK